MIFTILQILISAGLIAAILLQSQGSGLTGTFGGRSEVYRSKQSMEKFLLWATYVLAGAFAILSIILLIRH